MKLEMTVSYTHLRAHETDSYLVCRLLLEKDGFIKTNIKKEATYRINFCREETKKAIPKLIKKLPEGVVLDDERKALFLKRLNIGVSNKRFTF